MKVTQSCLTLCDPTNLYSPWNSPCQNTGMHSLSLLQGIFPTQGSNSGLPHCRRILYQLSHKGSPRILEWGAYPFSSRSSQLRNWSRVSCIAEGQSKCKFANVDILPSILFKRWAFFYEKAGSYESCWSWTIWHRLNPFVLHVTGHEAIHVVVLFLQLANPAAQLWGQEQCGCGPGWSGSCSGADGSAHFGWLRGPCCSGRTQEGWNCCSQWSRLGYSSPVLSLSHVRLFASPWSVAHQVPLSMGFARQAYWSGLLLFRGPQTGNDSETRMASQSITVLGRDQGWGWRWGGVETTPEDPGLTSH